jgi:hypothetical protein
MNRPRMNRPQTAYVAMLLGVATLWVASGLVPPSQDLVRTAYREGQADGALFWDTSYYVAWSVPGILGHAWTCRVHLDIIADPRFIENGYYDCSPWPWAAISRGRY